MNSDEMNKAKLEKILEECQSFMIGLKKADIDKYLPRMLDYTLELSRSLPGANISKEFFFKPSHNNHKIFLTNYFIEKGEIYQMFFDPSTDIMDSGESYETKVSKEEFFKWINQDESRAVDVIKRLSDYINKAPIYKKLICSNHTEFIEASKRYP